MDLNKFYETWHEELQHHIHHLTNSPRPPTTPDHHHQLTQLVNQLLLHFSQYYRVTSLAATQNTLFYPRWSTTLERSLHWLTGWRPTTFFHLLYTESGILFESRLFDIIHGVQTGDLADLTAPQLTQISELQCETVKLENAISDEMSEWQDDAVGVMGRTSVDVDIIGQLVKIVDKANDLRLRTLAKVVEVLTPQQAVELMIAAARLQLGIRRLGLKHDRERIEPSNQNQKVY
ncbi:putative transcription factor TGA like domain-containing protein [Helianthus debilis subsp. tardiflorus]